MTKAAVKPARSEAETGKFTADTVGGGKGCPCIPVSSPQGIGVPLRSLGAGLVEYVDGMDVPGEEFLERTVELDE